MNALADIEERLEQRAGLVEARLRQLLGDVPLTGEIARPERLIAAMRHGVLNGGKRLRPFLLIESAIMLGGRAGAALDAAAALECVHCYSLVHDDLPAMDDDDVRRGELTVHRAYDEATAILAGDALLTIAFDILSRPSSNEGELSDRQRLELVAGLARSSGLGGMAGGQMLDLQAESGKPGEGDIIQLQAMKTGALIRYACEAGAIVSGASAADRERLSEFGAAIGLAFQLADDLLDITASSDVMGKATGKDASRGKGTLVGLHGANWARSQLAGLVKQAEELLESYGDKADVLKAAARFVAERNR